ncbi:MAG TPA: transglycosylase SLT domain-containing protein [Steroidobacteraceae bacterium]|nr:transglycosylase SLT domain-containing protein [Steroidobacteraceae bacterium]
MRTTILLLLLSILAPAAWADSLASGREAFRDAIARVEAGQPDDPAGDSEALRAYPLYRYLEQARLSRRLRSVPGGASGQGLLPVDAEIEAFLARHAEEPVSRGLRRAWLESLADRGKWAEFLAQYRPEIDDGATRRCQTLVARIRLGRTTDLAEDISDTWLSPKSLPDACDPAFAWLKEQGRLSAELIERRARLALADGESGLARYLARSLPEAQAAPLLTWAGLIDQPAGSVDALIANPARPVEPQALLAGWSRLARRDPDGAAARFPGLVAARGLDPRSASPYALATALGASWSRKPYALEFFGRAQPEDFDEVAHEWHVRAALWTGDWARAARAIEAMPEELREHSRWRYWAARAAEQLGDIEPARARFAAVVPTDNWYAVLASARLGQSFAPTLEPMAITDEGISEVSRLPAMQRARELELCEMRSEAGSEWRASFDALAPSLQLQAIGLASSWGWHLEAVAAAARLGLYNDYERLYPRPYDPEVRDGAELTGLAPELIYAIIRQESLYRADAASSAGALGLMQLLPSTAARTARRWDLPVPTRASLLVPSVNVPLGSATLKSLLDRADGQTALAMAGYNAGPAAARRWLPGQPMDLDVWVENIPYNETRGYIQRASWHTVVFRWLAEREPRSYANWLGPLRPPGVDAALKPGN